MEDEASSLLFFVEQQQQQQQQHQQQQHQQQQQQQQHQQHQQQQQQLTPQKLIKKQRKTRQNSLYGDHSTFCCLCGHANDTFGCTSCWLSYHSNCITKNPHLAKFGDDTYEDIVQHLISHNSSSSSSSSSSLSTSSRRLSSSIMEQICNLNSLASQPSSFCLFSEGAKLQEEESTASPIGGSWVCPRCKGVCIPEVKPKVLKRSRFLLNKGLASFPIPGYLADSLANSYPETGSSASSSGNKRPKRKTDLVLSKLSDDHLSCCVVAMCESVSLRIITAFDLMIKASLKNEKQTYFEVCTSIAWLLSNVISFCENQDAITKMCREVATKVVHQWVGYIDKASSSPQEKQLSNLNLCMFEVLSAQRVINPDNLDILNNAWKERHTTALFSSEEEKSLVSIKSGLVSDSICPNCGESANPLFPLCKKCNFRFSFPLRSFPFQKITDSIIWNRVFYGTMPMDRLEEMLKVVKLFRPYRSVEEIGYFEFHAQLYLLVHLIFVASDWGKCSVPPDMVPEEFLFLKSSIRVAVAFDDVDLCGLLLQCMRIFGLTKYPCRSTWTQSSILCGTIYILGRERKFGGSGRLFKQNCTLINKSKTTYSGLMGLLAFRPYLDKPEPSPEIKALFKVFSETDGSALLLPSEIARPLRSIDLLTRKLAAAYAPPPCPSHLVPFKLTHNDEMVVPCPLTSFTSGVEWEDSDNMICSDLKLPPPDVVTSKSRGEKTLMRVGRSGMESCVFGLDLAAALGLHRTIFSRLVSRVTSSLPCGVIKPSGETSEESNFCQINNPITLQQLYPLPSAAASGALPRDLHCNLDSNLVVIKGKDVLGVLVSQSLLLALIDIVESELFEESCFVNLVLLKSLTSIIFDDHQSFVQQQTIETVPVPWDLFNDESSDNSQSKPKRLKIAHDNNNNNFSHQYDDDDDTLYPDDNLHQFVFRQAELSLAKFFNL